MKMVLTLLPIIKENILKNTRQEKSKKERLFESTRKRKKRFVFGRGVEQTV